MKTPINVSQFHFQVLNAKGSIKVLPFGGKILTKPTTSASNLFIMNTSESLQASTISTTSTPVVMTSKLQDSRSSVTNTEMSNIQTVDAISDVLTDGKENITPAKTQGKSSVLAEILKASGVTSSDSETYSDDIENQITQLTQIPKGAKNDLMGDAQTNNAVTSVSVANVENAESAETENKTYNIRDLNEHYISTGLEGKYLYVHCTFVVLISKTIALN